VKGQVTLNAVDSQAKFNVTQQQEAKEFLYFISNEMELVSDLLTRLKQEDTFFDVGSHIGLYTCLVAASPEDVDVVSFEPYPPTFERLNDNVRLNDARANTVQLALSDRDGTAILPQPVDETDFHGSVSLASDVPGSGIEVATKRGDSLVGEELQQPSVVKIDVEGAELDVIEGMEETLRSDDCRLLYCECHIDNSLNKGVSEFDASPGDVHQVLETYGFNVEWVSSREGQAHIRAEK